MSQHRPDGEASEPAWIPVVGPEEADVETLRRAGWSDEAILHACEVVAYFNFVNRTADGLGVSLEERWDHPVVPLADGDDD